MSLYDHPSSQQPEAATTNAPATSDAAATLYAKPEPFVDKTVNEAQRADRATGRSASTEGTLYDVQKTYAGVLPDDAADVFTDVPAAREVLADLQVDATDAKELLTAIRQLQHLPAEGEDHDDMLLFGRPLSELPRSEWHAASLAMTVPAKGTNTPQISAADLARAQQYVMRDPRVVDVLNRTRLGNHPHVVKRAVELARQHALKGSK